MKNPILSICIPVYNRNFHLENCLNSIKISSNNFYFNFEVCVSDNFSDQSPLKIIKKYEKYFKIKYNQNTSNQGLGVNILKSVSLANGEFIWIIGSDDLILPKTFERLNFYFQNKEIDFFLINSFHMNVDYILKKPQPFDTHDLTNNLKSFSNYKKNKECKLYQLVDPSISFDFMLGMFLNIFRRKIWNDNLGIINERDLKDLQTYSTFDNTAPHIKIFSYGFLNKKSYFVSECLSVNLSGVREWSDYYPFIESFRIPDVLKYYRKNGLSLLRYFYCMNFSNRKFLINLFKILFVKKYKGKKYLVFYKDIFHKLFYPSVYIGFIFYCLRKVFKLIIK